MTWPWVLSFCGVYTLGVVVGVAAAKIVEGRRARQRLLRFIEQLERTRQTAR